MSDQKIVLTEEYICRELPNYVDEVIQFKGSVAEYDLCFASGPKRHGDWVLSHSYGSRRSVVPGETIDEARTIKIVKCFVCDHAGKPRTHIKLTNSDDRPAKKSRISGPSIKVGCTAKFRYKEMLSGQVEVSYSWAHKNHNPVNTFDIGQSRLPKDARDWIATHVDNNMDWKSIKPLLRLSHEQMDNVSVIRMLFK